MNKTVFLNEYSVYRNLLDEGRALIFYINDLSFCVTLPKTSEYQVDDGEGNFTYYPKITEVMHFIKSHANPNDIIEMEVV